MISVELHNEKFPCVGLLLGLQFPHHIYLYLDTTTHLDMAWLPIVIDFILTYKGHPYSAHCLLKV